MRSKDLIFQAFLKQELLELEQGSSVATKFSLMSTLIGTEWLLEMYVHSHLWLINSIFVTGYGEMCHGCQHTALHS